MKHTTRSPEAAPRVQANPFRPLLPLNRPPGNEAFPSKSQHAQCEGKHIARLVVERRLFRAGFAQSYLLILQDIAQKTHSILSSLLEPKWSQVVKI